MNDGIGPANVMVTVVSSTTVADSNTGCWNT